MQATIHNKVKEAADHDYSKGKLAEYGTLEHSIYQNKASSFENGCFWYDTNICEPLKQQLSSLQEDNERLRKALQEIASATYAHKEWSDMHKVNHIATEALQNK